MEPTANTGMLGPFAYENWLAHLQNKPITDAEEYMLFTDAYITGELSTGCGPYQLINMVPSFGRTELKPTLALRVQFYEGQPPSTLIGAETNVERYHAGYVHDEIAALLSLTLGIRLKAGGLSRRFDQKGDVRGRPVGYDPRGDPALPFRSQTAFVQPFAFGMHSLESSNQLLSLPKTDPIAARALVKAARLFQDAIWIVESETSLAWVLLVSAVETVASAWRRRKVPAVERLRLFKPELSRVLHNHGGSELEVSVAEMIADYMGATKTFVDFLLEFLPEPPSSRPLAWGQIDWDAESLSKTFSKIYSWRSKALHGGVPFPFPMCLPPHVIESSFSEKPIGLAMAAQGGVWTAEDTPIQYHTFEHIARRSILAWWASNTSA